MPMYSTKAYCSVCSPAMLARFTAMTPSRSWFDGVSNAASSSVLGVDDAVRCGQRQEADVTDARMEGRREG
jgi:hypothetical protein